MPNRRRFVPDLYSLVRIYWTSAGASRGALLLLAAIALELGTVYGKAFEQCMLALVRRERLPATGLEPEHFVLETAQAVVQAYVDLAARSGAPPTPAMPGRARAAILPSASSPRPSPAKP